MKPPHLQVNGLTKRFGSLLALDQVDLELAPGVFGALIGENGAGKSTLAKCVMGFYPRDSGEIVLDGKPSAIAAPQDARSHGIGMVFQHFTLVPSMTVAENLVLARPDLPKIIHWPHEIEGLEKFLETAPFAVDLQIPVARLSAGQKQKVEILKQLYLKTRVLILDEPTSVLTPEEADEVLGLLRSSVDAGELSVLIITHKFREVMTFADEVTVLRRGRMAGQGRKSDLSPSRMAEMMMGESRMLGETEKIPKPPGEGILKLRNIRAIGDNGLEVLHGINLTVRAGEIVGIAGVSGNGQRELVEVIAGQRALFSGEILIREEAYSPTRREIRRQGFFTLPEEPLRNAAIPAMSVAENMALRVYDREPFARWGFLLNEAEIRSAAVGLIKRFDVKTPSLDEPIGTLSGGNVQRAILARELSANRIQALVASNPCFGLDFKAVSFIHNQIIDIRNRGAAVLLISEDLDELLAVADRIAVMSGGSIVHESVTKSADLTTIGKHMAGHPTA